MIVREKHQLLASRTPPLPPPPTQACALPGNRTSDLSARRPAVLNPLSHSSQGSKFPNFDLLDHSILGSLIFSSYHPTSLAIDFILKCILRLWDFKTHFIRCTCIWLRIKNYPLPSALNLHYINGSQQTEQN